jgi:hypothetical protein
MALPLALLFGANIGLGALRANQAAKQRQQEANIRAAEIEASPWTGRAPSTQVSTQALNPWAEMAGGVINAAGQAAALENAGLFKDTQTPILGGTDKKFSLWNMPQFTTQLTPLK